MKSTTTLPRRNALRSMACITALAAGIAGWQFTSQAFGAETAVVIAPPAIDEPVGSTNSETAVFAGGCFWGVQGVFQHVRGVTSAVSGYTGGAASTARYEIVGSGNTGHAESVQVTFDPKQVSYGTLLQIFFSVAHNPTQLNRQGPDSGTQYRSAIFPTSEAQERVARAYIAQLDNAHSYAKPIVTRIEKSNQFYAAENYHQNFLTLHPNHPYIVVNDLPKVMDLKRLFPTRYQPEATLVKTSSR